MQVEFDSDKRAKTLAERGLDFARAGEVFAQAVATAKDDRFAYEEDRYTTFGLLDGRLVVMAWTLRGAVRRIISLRKANDREQTRYSPLG